MMNKILLFALLVSSAASAALTEPDYSTLLNTKNYAANGGAENSKTGWTVSGTGATLADLAVVTGAANIYEGNAAFTWTPSNADNFLSNKALPITSAGGLSGTNCAAVVWTKTSSTTKTIQAYDGTNILASQPIPASTSFRPNTIYWPCSTSGTNQIRFGAGDTTAISLDSLKWGDARMVGLTPIVNIIDPTAYTPTFTGIGTASNINAQYMKIGPELMIWGTATAGTVVASTFSISLPSVFSIDSTKYNGTRTQQVGNMSNTVNTGTFPSSSTGPFPVFVDVNASTSVVYSASTSNGEFIKQNGNGPFSNSAPFNFLFTVYVTSGPTLTALKPDQTPAFWAGFHDATCSWSRTNTALGAFTADSTCTFTQRTNVNFGTVTSALSGSDKLPGIVFTPNIAGSYWVCATGSMYSQSTSSYASASLSDGTTTIATSWNRQGTSASSNAGSALVLCGIYNALNTSPVTLTVSGAASAGAVTLDTAGAATGVNALDWSITQLSGSISCPLLVGSVTSNSTGLERIERLTFGGNAAGTTACTSSPCTISRQSGSWVTSVTRSSAGNYVVNFNASNFSSVPTCSCTAGHVANTFCELAETSSTIVIGAVTPPATSTDDAVSLICMGPR